MIMPARWENTVLGIQFLPDKAEWEFLGRHFLGREQGWTF